MKIAIDVREACQPHPTGKGRWVRGLVTELLKRDVRLLGVSQLPLPQDWKQAGMEELVIQKNGFGWHRAVVSALRERKDIDIVLWPTSYIVPWLLKKKMNVVPVVHDLIAFRHELHDRKATFIERFTLKKAMKYAYRICTVSDATTQDLLKKYRWIDPAKITSIFAGPMRESPPPSHPDGSTILCIGTLCPRKNQLRLIHAFKSLPDDVRRRFTLVLAGGRGWNDDAILTALQDTLGTRYEGFVDDERYDQLMASATIFALPSLYEGFGLQILDALQRGIPVLTSDRGSLEEVVGSAAVIVNPTSTKEIALGLQRLMTDQALRTKLSSLGPAQAAQYSWKRTVDLLLNSL